MVGILYLFAAFTICFYGAILLLLIVAIYRLSRRWWDPIGLACLALALTHPAFLLIEIASDKIQLATRAKVVQSFERVVIPDPLPRNLVVVPQTSGGELPDYIIDVTASGKFTVYVLQHDAPPAIAKVAQGDVCTAEREKSGRHFVIFGAAMRCALLVPTQAVPSEALVLYEGPSQAPLAPREFGHPGDYFRRVDMVRQLSVRHEGKENLIAYEEYIAPKEARVEWPGGVLVGIRSIQGQSGWMWPGTKEFLYRNLNMNPEGEP
jgi:hypothetical protein